MKRIYLIFFVLVLLISSCNITQEKNIIGESEKQVQEQVVNNQDNKEIELSNDEIQILEDLLNF